MITAIGDLHYGKLTHLIPNFNKLLSQTLERTVEEALTRGTEAIVLVGDVFNSAYPSQTDIIDFLACVTKFDVPFYIIPGNHDFADISIDSLQIARFTRSRFKSNLVIIDRPKLMKIGGNVYQFMPHPFVEDMHRKAQFAFAHFAVSGATADNGFKVKHKNHPKGNFILGDFHTAQAARYKQCVYEYVGSLTQLAFEEEPIKSVLDIEEGEKLKRRVNPAYRLKKLIIGSDDELDSIKFQSDTFYHLKTKGGYVLPKGWSLEHPQVIKQSAVAMKKDKRAEMFISSESLINPLTYLKPYLLQKSPTVADRAYELAEGLKIAS